MKVTKISSKAILFLMAGLCFSACASRRSLSRDTVVRTPSGLVESLTQIQPPATAEVLPPVREQPSPSAPVHPSSFTSANWEQRIAVALDSLCTADSLATTSQIGVSVFDLTAATPLYVHNAHHRMRPASCQKLLTAISALYYLGSDYRLRTSVFTSGTLSNGVLTGNVYVVGGMDPMVTPVEIQGLVQQLRAAGIRRVRGKMCKDLTMTDCKPYGWGWCWDDDYGPLSALLVEGKDRFSALWHRQLVRQGISVTGPDTLVNAVCPSDARFIGSVEHTVSELLLPIMKESDNIYAECLFYQLAAHSRKPRAGRKQAVSLMNEMMEKANINTAALCVADGSGLSLYNYLTPDLLTRLLVFAHQQPQVFQALMASLPIAGVDGTLEKRMLGSVAQGKVWAKTGSVSGLSSLSGYAQASNGHLLAFTIINQGVVRTAHGRAFQDKVCEILCR